MKNVKTKISKDMLDFIKFVVKKKPHIVIIHAGTNSMATVNKKNKLVQRVRQIYKYKFIQIGFPSTIHWEDKDLGK